jgi:hypothetical protein
MIEASGNVHDLSPASLLAELFWSEVMELLRHLPPSVAALFLGSLNALLSLHEETQRIRRELLGSLLRTAYMEGYSKELTNSLVSRFQQASPKELGLLQDLLKIPGIDLGELLDGSQYEIRDNGQYYRRWIALLGGYARDSSHPWDGARGFDGDFVKTALFGISRSTGNTRIQFEKAPHHGAWWNNDISSKDDQEHIESFILHELTRIKDDTGKDRKPQIGPVGISAHSDDNPIVVVPPSHHH